MQRTWKSWSLVVLALALAVCWSACGEDEEPPPPVASVVFLNQAADLGAVEFLLDGKVVRTVMPGMLSAAVENPLGQVAVQARNPGAAQGLLEENFDLREQLHHDPHRRHRRHRDHPDPEDQVARSPSLFKKRGSPRHVVARAFLSLRGAWAGGQPSQSKK